MAWAKQGCHADLPLALAAHARECHSCAEFIAEVVSARQLAALVPTHRLSVPRLESIRTLLRTETRRPRSVGFVPRGTHRYWQWLAVVALGLLAGTAGVAAVLVRGEIRSKETPPKVAPTLPTVVVRLVSGAHGHTLGESPDSPYELVDGKGEFDVARRDESSTFRIVAGGNVLETTQARFRVEVSNTVLSRVEVTDGHVTIRKGITETVTLGPGQAYSPVPPASVVVAVAPSASTRMPNTRVPDDTAFAYAFRLLGAGQPGQAATAFDALLGSGPLDASRRADVLYWSAQAHARTGNATLAEARARAYLDGYPGSLHYGDAALLLGDFARNRGAKSQARSYYERALGTSRPATRARAQKSLSLLEDP
jgi:hypothetical protein